MIAVPAVGDAAARTYPARGMHGRLVEALEDTPERLEDARG